MCARSGFSLVEAEVALVLLAVGLLAIAGTGARASRLLRAAEAEQDAGHAAVSVLDSLAQLQHPAAGWALGGRHALEWSTASAGAAIRVVLIVVYADGSGERADTFAAMAARWPARLRHAP